MREVTVLIVEDHEVVREGLRALLRADPAIQVVGEAEDGLRAIELAQRLRPEVVLMDVDLPELNGFEATRRITRQLPSTRVLVLTCYEDAGSVQAMAKAGAVGFFTKRSVAGELIEAIHNLRNTFFGEIAPVGALSEVTVTPALTPRELEVLRLIAQGLTNRRIGDVLGISIKTVEKHRQCVMNKLRIHHTAGLTRYAISQGLLANPRALPRSDRHAIDAAQLTGRAARDPLVRGRETEPNAVGCAQ